LIGTKNAGYGDVEVSIDGSSVQTVSLANASRQLQTVLFKTQGLAKGPHKIKIVNKGEALVVLDAFKVVP
jgi:hypothetical protein